MFRLIVFDLDGTLVDSRRDLADSANAVLAACACQTLPEDAIGRMVGDGAAALVSRAFDAAGGVPPPDALERFLAAYGTRLLASTRAYEGMHDALETLASRATLAVLTNKPMQAATAILQGLDLSRFFQRVIGGDGPDARKPDPAGLRSLMSAMGAATDQTVLVGDSAIDWRTAQAAGTRACMVAYGFGFLGFSVGSLASSDYLVHHPSELPLVL